MINYTMMPVVQASEIEKAVEKKEESIDDLIDEMATAILKENERYIGKEVTEEAIKRVKGKKQKKEENANDKEEKKRTRRTTKTNANA